MRFVKTFTNVLKSCCIIGSSFICTHRYKDFIVFTCSSNVVFNKIERYEVASRINRFQYINDIIGTFLDVNQAGLDELGYTRDELRQMKIPEIDAQYSPGELDAIKDEEHAQ